METFLKDKTVVIVGPAPSIIGSNQGKLIDSFDIVIRLNKALPIPEHLKHLGMSHTEPIRRLLNSFENAIWLAFLRGKHAKEDELPSEKEIKNMITISAVGKLAQLQHFDYKEDFTTSIEHKINNLSKAISKRIK